MIVLETDGKDEWIATPTIDDPFQLSPEVISLRVGAAGIVGLGGATFPTAVKLNMGRENHIDTLIINGAECEPYLSCDDRLMQGGGRSSGVVAVKALDHDLCHKEKLVPGGILEPVTGRSFLFFGTHHKTSDFMADGIILWWEEKIGAANGKAAGDQLGQWPGMQWTPQSIPSPHDRVCR
jgi:hypothetical protein